MPSRPNKEISSCSKANAVIPGRSRSDSQDDEPVDDRYRPENSVRDVILILLPAVIGLGALVAISFGVILPAFKRHAVDRKKSMLQDISSVVLSTLGDFERAERDGKLSRDKAQAEALKYLRDLRYGPDRKDYFWVHDLHPRMLMHPYRPELDGQDLSDFRDHTGNAVFMNMVRAAVQGTDGYVQYHWQWKDDPSREIGKVSYVRLFRPWGWVVGTGLYFDDVESETRYMVGKVTRWTSLATVLMGLCSGLAAWQNLRASRLRDRFQSALEESNRKLIVRNSELGAQREALRRSEGRYRVLVETMGEAVASTDPDLLITYVNRQACVLSGYAQDELVGKRVHCFLDEANRAILEASLTRHLGGDDSSYEIAIIRKNGEQRTCVVSPCSLTDDEGTETGILAVFRDVTEQKEEERKRRSAEETARMRELQLLQADKMVALGTLVSGVAHEINNPNHFIQLNASVLQEVFTAIRPMLDARYSSEGEFRIGKMPYSRLRERLPRMIQAITEGSERIKRIVADLRDFVRPSDAGATEKVDLNAVVGTAVNLMRNLIGKSTNDFRVVTCPDLPNIQGNAQRLEQVIINLLQNACFALEERSQGIKISTEWNVHKSQVTVKIRDNGAGIPSEVLRRIKDPFFTTRRNSGGTGLGLSVSSTIIEQHRGTLEFTSTSGEGTLATLSLPVLAHRTIDREQGEQG